MSARGDAIVSMNRWRVKKRDLPGYIDAAIRPAGERWQRQRRVSQLIGNALLPAPVAIGEVGDAYASWNVDGRSGEKGVFVNTREP